MEDFPENNPAFRSGGGVSDPAVVIDRRNGYKPSRRSSNCRVGTVERSESFPPPTPHRRLEGFQPFQPYN